MKSQTKIIYAYLNNYAKIYSLEIIVKIIKIDMPIILW